MSPDALAALLAARHSCRAFLADPVPAAVLDRAFQIAQGTASWCNTQPWRVKLVTGAALVRFRDALLAHVAAGGASGYDLGEPTYSGVSRERRLECALALYGAVGVARGDRAASQEQGMHNYRFFGAPHVALITCERDLGTYGAVDCGAYVANLMLAATSLGLGCIAQGAIAGYSAFVRSHFALDEDRSVVCAVSLGYEDVAHRANAFRTSRVELSAVIDRIDS